jgi:outer membrane receptor protein involved in Fe transport
MTKTVKPAKRNWMLGAAGLAVGLIGSGQALAQVAPDDEEAPVAANEIVVIGEIQYRDRSEVTAPTLEYGLDYFQRFEPLTVGDALKRVPSVAFLSDVLESDGVRLRGLDPAYTQILINGEKVPGSGSSSGAFGNGADSAFFVDRIPAELIERVEVVRSASANRSGDALAGAINIVLRDSYSLDGGYVRAGIMYFDGDRHFGETISAVWGGEFGGGRLLLGANMQDRHNPKRKFSARYDLPPGATGQNLINIEDQTDVRDGTDYAFNFAYEVDAFGGELELDGFFIYTDRQNNEDSIEYRNPTPTGGSRPAFADLRVPAQLLTVNDNNVDIEQTSWSLKGDYEVDSFGGETTVKLGWARFVNNEFEIEDENEYLRDSVIFPEVDRYTGDQVRVDLEDNEVTLKLEHERDLGEMELEFGVHVERKERLSRISERDPRIRVSLPNGTQSFTAKPNTTLPLVSGFGYVTGGDNTIERTKIDPFAMLSGEVGNLSWEAGLRYEATDISIEDRTAGANSVGNDYGVVLPSAHLKWAFTEDDRITASVARTVRSPSFAFLSPAVLETELEDNDFVGNPNLKPETAWGFDLGYERRIGKTGVMGINLFYRDVTDLIEISNTGDEGSEGPGTFVYSARNSGEGTVYGVEFDLSTSLSFIGWDNTGVFLNYSWLDSEIDDEFGSRRFNSQAESVFNIGFIQDLPAIDASFGATYREQGEAFSRIVSEEVTTTYGADLEVFVERRLGDNFTIRLTGSNLLDAEKEELFGKFLTEADQRARAFDEFEFETENAGPVYQIIGRYAF